MKKLNLPGRRGLALVLTTVLVGLLGLVVTPGVAAAAPTFHSFSAGVFEIGEVKHYWWNNANADAYGVGLSSTAVIEPPYVQCDATVTRRWGAGL